MGSLVQTPIKLETQALQKLNNKLLKDAWEPKGEIVDSIQIQSSTHGELHVCLICMMEFISKNKLHDHLILVHQKLKNRVHSLQEIYNNHNLY